MPKKPWDTLNYSHMNPKVIHIGAAIFVVRDGAILLGKRKNTYGAGDWGLPGGHLEYGEKLVNCALRELAEEVGIQANVSDLSLTTIVDDPRDDQHYLHVAFTYNSVKDEIRLMEPEKCEGWKFFPVTELPPNIFIGHKRILDTYVQGKMYLC